MKKIMLLFCILPLYQLVNGQSGTPDPSFGNNGYISTFSTQTASIFSTFPRQCFIQPDGKFILVLQANTKTRITRRLSNGDLDVSYANNGYSEVASMYVITAAMQADGKIVAAGSTDGAKDFMLARFNTDGTLDPSFGNNGVTITDIGTSFDNLTSVAITSDGKIIAGGSVLHNGHNHFVLVRYSAAGQIDNTFGNNGFVFTDFNNSNSSLSSLAIQPDGKILAAGITFLNDAGDFALARYNADGTPDLSFNFTGKTTSNFSFQDWGRSIAINSDGKIYVGGQISDASGFSHFGIARYNSDGSLDFNFNSGSGFVTAVFGTSSDFLTNIRIQGDGKIVASGHTNLYDPDFDIELIRVNTNGAIDNSFGTSGNGLVIADVNSGSDESAYLVIQNDGKIVTGGSNLDFTNTSPFNFSGFRYNTNGTPDAGFGDGGHYIDFVAGSFYSYYALFKQNDGKLLAIGEANGEAGNRVFISRFNANGTPDNTYGQNGTHELDHPGRYFFQPDGKLLILSFSFNTTGDIMLSRYNPDGSPDAGFGNGGSVITDLGGDEFANDVAFQPDGKFIIGGGLRDNNGADFLLIRYNSNGSVDGSFGTNGFVRVNYVNEDQVQSIAIAPDGKIIFSGNSIMFPPDFSSIHFDGYIARLNSNGSFDTNFGDQGKVIIDRPEDDFVGTVLVQNNNKIIFARSESLGGPTIISFISRLNADGSVDNSFGQNGNTPCDGGIMVQQADQKILILGALIDNRNNTDYSLARFTSEGIADMSFGTNGKTIGSFTNIDNFFISAIVAGDRFFAAGAGVDVMGSNLGIIAKFRLEPEASISCPANKVVNTDNNLCAAIVNGIDPTVTPNGASVNYTFTGATTGSGSGFASGSVFNKGITTITYSLPIDPTKSCSFTVTVQDIQLPVISNLSVSQTTLWPANHKLRDIAVDYSASDNCGIANTQVSVTSNEPVQTGEPEDVSPDWQIVDNHNIRLRAERLESGTGRIYTITVTVTDASGNQTIATTTVNVPKSMGNGDPNLLVRVSPNPSTSYFLVSINSNSDDKINLRLLNNKGTVLSKMNSVNPEQMLKIGDKLMPGIYFLEVTQSGITKTMKIIKQ